LPESRGDSILFSAVEIFGAILISNQTLIDSTTSIAVVSARTKRATRQKKAKGNARRERRPLCMAGEVVERAVHFSSCYRLPSVPKHLKTPASPASSSQIACWKEEYKKGDSAMDY